MHRVETAFADHELIAPGLPGNCFRPQFAASTVEPGLSGSRSATAFAEVLPSTGVAPLLPADVPCSYPSLL